MSFEDEIKKYFPNLCVSRETYERYDIYYSQILIWNHAISLVQKQTLDDFCIRHIIDSLQIANFLPLINSSIVDLGTGAGFPGMVLAMHNYSNVSLVEANLKKTHFLHETARLSKTKVCIINNRAENILGKFDFVISRACSSLSNLLFLMKNVSRETTQGIFHKGASYNSEIEEAKKYWKFEFELHTSITNKQSKIILIKNLEKK